MYGNLLCFPYLLGWIVLTYREKVLMHTYKSRKMWKQYWNIKFVWAHLLSLQGDECDAVQPEQESR